MVIRGQRVILDRDLARVYGVTTAGGSDINSNDHLATIKYPDTSSGSPSTLAADQQSFAYNTPYGGRRSDPNQFWI